jgi:hypothetical protein
MGSIQSGAVVGFCPTPYSLLPTPSTFIPAASPPEALREKDGASEAPLNQVR